MTTAALFATLRTQFADAAKPGLTGDVPKVEDCGFRMLQPHEIQAAMAFPVEYKVLGTKRERVKQLGNAVTPPAMAILMQRVMETFN